MFEGCGDPALAETLLERLSAELDRDEDVARYETYDSPAWELFGVEVRFGDHVSEGAALEEKMQRLSAIDAGSRGKGPSDSQGQASLCSHGRFSWIDLEG
jgi:hypothetical protein